MGLYTLEEVIFFRMQREQLIRYHPDYADKLINYTIDQMNNFAAMHDLKLRSFDPTWLEERRNARKLKASIPSSGDK